MSYYVWWCSAVTRKPFLRNCSADMMRRRNVSSISSKPCVPPGRKFIEACCYQQALFDVQLLPDSLHCLTKVRSTVVLMRPEFVDSPSEWTFAQDGVGGGHTRVPRDHPPPPTQPAVKYVSQVKIDSSFWGSKLCPPALVIGLPGQKAPSLSDQQSYWPLYSPVSVGLFLCVHVWHNKLAVCSPFSHVLLCIHQFLFFIFYPFRPGYRRWQRWKTWSERCLHQGWVYDWRRWNDTCTVLLQQLRPATPVARMWWRPFTTCLITWRHGSHILPWWEQSSMWMCACESLCVCMCVCMWISVRVCACVCVCVCESMCMCVCVCESMQVNWQGPITTECYKGGHRGLQTVSCHQVLVSVSHPLCPRLWTERRLWVCWENSHQGAL